MKKFAKFWTIWIFSYWISLNIIYIQQYQNLHIIALCVGWLFLQIETFVNKYKRHFTQSSGRTISSVNIPALPKPLSTQTTQGLALAGGIPSINLLTIFTIFTIFTNNTLCSGVVWHVLKCRERLTRENTEFEAQLMFVSDAVMAFAHAVRDLHRWCIDWSWCYPCFSSMLSGIWSCCQGPT